MKTNIRNLFAAALLVLPAWALAAEDACCANEKDHVADGCCATEVAAIRTSAFAAPPPAPMAANSKALSEAETAFIAGYEKIHAALAADDFNAAKAAATGLDGAGDIAAAKSIKEARVAFKTLSEKAIAIGKGREGLHVIHCPMAFGTGADWLQPSKDVKNPYYGKMMLKCGSVTE